MAEHILYRLIGEMHSRLDDIRTGTGYHTQVKVVSIGIDEPAKLPAINIMPATWDNQVTAPQIARPRVDGEVLVQVQGIVPVSASDWLLQLARLQVDIEMAMLRGDDTMGGLCNWCRLQRIQPVTREAGATFAYTLTEFRAQVSWIAGFPDVVLS